MNYFASLDSIIKLQYLNIDETTFQSYEVNQILDQNCFD